MHSLRGLFFVLTITFGSSDAGDLRLRGVSLFSLASLDLITPPKAGFVLRLTDVSVFGLAPIFIAYRDGVLVRRGSDNPNYFKMPDPLNPHKIQGFGAVCTYEGVVLYGPIDYPGHTEIVSGLILDSKRRELANRQAAAKALSELYSYPSDLEVARSLVQLSLPPVEKKT